MERSGRKRVGSRTESRRGGWCVDSRGLYEESCYSERRGGCPCSGGYASEQAPRRPLVGCLNPPTTTLSSAPDLSALAQDRRMMEHPWAFLYHCLLYHGGITRRPGKVPLAELVDALGLETAEIGGLGVDFPGESSVEDLYEPLLSDPGLGGRSHRQAGGATAHSPVSFVVVTDPSALTRQKF